MKDKLGKTKLSVLVLQLKKTVGWLSRHLSEILKEILNIPLWVLSLLVPKDDRIWIFGAWMGEKYSDNLKYLTGFLSVIGEYSNFIGGVRRNIGDNG